MANCDSGNQTLDPLQTILDSTNNAIGTLENQARSIKPDVTLFDSIASSISVVSPVATFNNALTKLTAEALCASSTNLAPINDLEEACLNEALKGVKKYISNMLGNIEDGLDLVSEILALPENALMKQYQKLWKLCENIRGLVNGIDSKLQCVILADKTGEYTDQIEYSQDRVSSVIDDLKLGDDGGFDPDVLMDGLSSDLKTNMISYNTRANDLQTEILNDISSTVDLTASLNPKRKF